MHTRTARVAALAVVAIVVVACSGSSKKSAPSTTTTRSSSSASRSTSSSSSSGAPQGFLVIPAPDSIADPADFGQNVAVATTLDAAPVVAFTVLDPTTKTSNVLTATYDATTKRFKPTVTVASATVTDTRSSVSIARDTTGALVLAWDDSGKIMVGKSTDDGATWTTVAALPGGDDPSLSYGVRPAVAAAGGKVAVVYSSGADDVPAVLVANLSDLAFSPAGGLVPPPDMAARGSAPAIAAAPDGSFAVAYLVSHAADAGTSVVYQPVGGTAVVALDSNGAKDDAPSASLSFTATGPAVGVTLCRTDGEAATDACTYVTTSSDGGQTFGPPMPVASDAGDGPGLVTAFAIDRKGRGALAYEPATSTNAAKCGKPKVAVSTDLATWQVCSPDTDGSLRLAPADPALTFGLDNSLVLAFQQTSRTAKVPAGVLVVIYAAVGSGTAKQ